MLHSWFRQLTTRRTRWFYGLISAIAIVGVVFGHAAASQAISIWDIIRGGTQVLQGIQIESMSPQREMEFGKQIDNQIKGQLNRNRTPVISQNHPASQYVNEIGQRLVATLTDEERRVDKDKTGQGIQYTFQVVNDPGINAFATMGGFVYINSGLMAFADNEAQLASVIGHEMGHIIERHAIKQTKNEAIRRGILSAAGLDGEQIVQLGVTVALTLPNSREDETEADEVGLDVFRRGFYYPPSMPDFMAKLAQESGGGGRPTILSTHPNPSNRAEHLRAIIAANPPAPEENLGTDRAAYCAILHDVVNDDIPCGAN